MGGSILIQTTKEARIFLLPAAMESHARQDVVWAESKQIGLIDSVIRNYYIPPLIFGKPHQLPLLHLELLKSARKPFPLPKTGVKPAFALTESSV
jgi:hypothetical protein